MYIECGHMRPCGEGSTVELHEILPDELAPLSGLDLCTVKGRLQALLTSAAHQQPETSPARPTFSRY